MMDPRGHLEETGRPGTRSPRRRETGRPRLRQKTRTQTPRTPNRQLANSLNGEQSDSTRDRDRVINAIGLTRPARCTDGRTFVRRLSGTIDKAEGQRAPIARSHLRYAMLSVSMTEHQSFIHGARANGAQSCAGRKAGANPAALRSTLEYDEKESAVPRLLISRVLAVGVSPITSLLVYLGG